MRIVRIVVQSPVRNSTENLYNFVKAQPLAENGAFRITVILNFTEDLEFRRIEHNRAQIAWYEKQLVEMYYNTFHTIFQIDKLTYSYSKWAPER